jgi:hypothetical protein
METLMRIWRVRPCTLLCRSCRKDTVSICSLLEEAQQLGATWLPGAVFRLGGGGGGEGGQIAKTI